MFEGIHFKNLNGHGNTHSLKNFNCSTFAAIQSAVLSVVYHSGATATAGAIDRAVNEVFSQAHGGRAGVVKVSPLFNAIRQCFPMLRLGVLKNSQAF